MGKELFIGLGVLSLLFFSSSSSAARASAPSLPPPPPPPTPPESPRPSTEPTQLSPESSGFFNYTTGAPVPSDSFLNWAPGQKIDVPTNAPVATPKPPPSKKATVFPKAGEKWQMIWTLNRPLSFLEMIVGKSAFRSRMTNQTLDSAMQNVGPPTTVTLQTTFTKNSDGPIPLGQTLQSSGIIAKLTSMKKVG